MKIGIYNLHMHSKGGGEKRTLVLADHLSRNHQVWVFVLASEDVSALESYFDVDLSRVRFVPLNNLRRQSTEQITYWTRISTPFRHFLKIKSFGLDLFVNNSYLSNLPCPARRGIYMCMFPHDERASAARRWTCRSLLIQLQRLILDYLQELIMGHRVSEFLRSYSVITANSHFTASSIRHLWDRSAEVIYSVCDNMGPPTEKKKIILNVGRFVVNDDGLIKRQDVLVDVFSRLKGIHEQGWQLHFVGSVAQNSKTCSMIEHLTRAAVGIPIFFHFDADLETLRRLYRSASLYWHATGYGSTNPSAQEHFGMTTIEAMSAGAVPVVINSGGQKEIVHHGEDGFVWDDLALLGNQTTCLIQDPSALELLSKQAVASSARFGRQAFVARMDEIVERNTATTG